MIESKAAMIRMLNRLTIGDSALTVPLPGLSIIHYDEPGRVRHELYTPVLCMVLRGAKQIALGDQVHVVGAGQGLLVSAEVPVIARVEASPAQPYLAVAVDLDLALLDDIALQAGVHEVVDGSKSSLAVLPRPDERLLDCLARIVELTRRAHEAAILMPGLLRELHYLLLRGPLGGTLRRMARPDGHHRRIGRAIALLTNTFHDALPIATLAAAAGMSVSAFHHHFKAVTGCSPRQFQKQLRLLEARRLIQMEGASARRAAFTVGYASAQQFTRDHARQFGAPPRRSLHGAAEPALLVG
ncbi:AraC family transcriptional regulator N-terminal domain-containing protein [uncultured Sphingomonas sp.]|uniref:AraC family transcriptional regulator n=1 Tax=uncultured Sphingomonas sp. TaxID=158754 RepID=UPI0035CBC91E